MRAAETKVGDTDNSDAQVRLDVADQCALLQKSPSLVARIGGRLCASLSVCWLIRTHHHLTGALLISNSYLLTLL